VGEAPQIFIPGDAERNPVANSTTTARDEKLIQYLSEMFGNEKRLETALEAHIAMTTHAKYKQRLRQHLSETKRHSREVKKRIKQLGGEAEIAPAAPSALTDFAGALLSGAHKAAALAQGPLHALRGTGEEEKQLKNAKTEYAEEAQEIGAYTAIEALAQAVGDKDTAKLAREILREERRMFGFLEKEIVRLTNAVTRAEIPAAERKAKRSASRKAGSGRKASAARKAARSATARATGAKQATARKASPTRAKASGARGTRGAARSRA
jgi:ferritin-like metal-binding protein YciE